MRANTAETVMERLDVSGPCWIWTGPKRGKGYGYVSWENRKVSTHRLIWELLVGPIPEGMHLDHLCREKLCANPDHLELVTNAENLSRGQTGRYSHPGHDWNGDG